MIDPEEILSLPLNIEERGLHVTLIALQLKEKGLPGSVNELAEMVRMTPDRFDRLWERVGLAFELRDGQYVHPPTAEKQARRAEISFKRREAAFARIEQTNARVSGQVPALAGPDQANAARGLSSSGGSPPTPPTPSLLLSREETPPVVPPRKSRSKADVKASRVPQPFVVTPDMRAWAAEAVPGLDLDAATAEFVDHWIGVPGVAGKKLDWAGTWRNGMRRAYRLQRPPPRAAPRVQQQRSLTELTEKPTRGRYDDYAPPDD